jgi:hypothetical protein
MICAPTDAARGRQDVSNRPQALRTWLFNRLAPHASASSDRSATTWAGGASVKASIHGIELGLRIQQRRHLIILAFSSRFGSYE